jgi:hypothetical protein
MNNPSKTIIVGCRNNTNSCLIKDGTIELDANDKDFVTKIKSFFSSKLNYNEKDTTDTPFAKLDTICSTKFPDSKGGYTNLLCCDPKLKNTFAFFI